MTRQTFFDLMGLTLRAPREGAAAVAAMGLPRAVLWQLVILTAIVGTVISTALSLLVAPAGADEAFALSPFANVVMQIAVTIVMIYVTYWVGQMFDGRGALDEVFAAIVWLQIILLCLQLGLTLLMLVAPPLSGFFLVLAVAAFFYLLVHFVAEVHGYDSLGVVFVMVLGTMMATALVLSILLSILGIAAPQVAA